MKYAVIAVFASLVLGAGASCALAASEALPSFNPVSEDVSAQRRQVSVRIEHRLSEADLQRIGEAVVGRQKRTFSRTQVNFFLPGMPIQQGAWATATFALDPKVTIHGLRLEDEEVLLAEHLSDQRPLLGSWLTSPPAAPGRLTIYSDHGRIFAEWRLRNGQRTIDELQDAVSKAGRRFDVIGGGYYILTRTGDLELWDKTTMIATAERIRPEHLALPAAVALGPMAPVVPVAQAAVKPAPVVVSVPVQDTTQSTANSATVPAATPSAPQIAGADAPAAAVPVPGIATLDPKARHHKQATSRHKPPAETHASHQAHSLTPGEQIVAKMGHL